MRTRVSERKSTTPRKLKVKMNARAAELYSQRLSKQSARLVASAALQEQSSKPIRDALATLVTDVPKARKLNWKQSKRKRLVGLNPPTPLLFDPSGTSTPSLLRPSATSIHSRLGPSAASIPSPFRPRKRGAITGRLPWALRTFLTFYGPPYDLHGTTESGKAAVSNPIADERDGVSDVYIGVGSADYVNASAHIGINYKPQTAEGHLSFRVLVNWSWSIDLSQGGFDRPAHCNGEVGLDAFSTDSAGDDVRLEGHSPASLVNWGTTTWDRNHNDSLDGKVLLEIGDIPLDSRRLYQLYFYALGECDCGGLSGAKIDVGGFVPYLVTEESGFVPGIV